jgi:hypothetical protein
MDRGELLESPLLCLCSHQVVVSVCESAARLPAVGADQCRTCSDFLGKMWIRTAAHLWSETKTTRWEIR